MQMQIQVKNVVCTNL